MRWLVRQSIKGSRVRAFNHYFLSNITKKVFELISEELIKVGNFCEIIEAQTKCIQDIRKQKEK